MLTTADRCPNYQINIQLCPCTSDGCERRGVCCECIAAHREAGSATACMNGASRPEATLRLRGVLEGCPSLERNASDCPCPGAECPRRGICCECVRNHWLPDGAGRIFCFT